MERDKVVLVDIDDKPVGEMDKIAAHQQGALHRAFSVFVFNNQGELLIQQRASSKYHGAGLWTNTCCSHPQWGENVEQSAMERLEFEMGLQCKLKFSHSFIYKSEVENNLIEHEYDHVFIGITNEDPVINPDEVQDFAWVNVNELLDNVKMRPQNYTYWFKLALPVVLPNLHR